MDSPQRAWMASPAAALLLLLLMLPVSRASLFNTTALTIAGSGSSSMARFMYQAADILMQRAKVGESSAHRAI